MNDIELTMLPHACLSAQLANVTLQAVQKLLEQAYLNWRANPAYLFCSDQDCEALNADAAKNIAVFESLRPDKDRIMIMDPMPGKLVAITNYTTGRLVYVITLPEMEPGKLQFGFFTY